MKILITAGGTTEAIDTVRGITNFATGSLGKVTAEAFLAEGHQVLLLAGKQALLPKTDKNLTLVSISDTQSLLESMKSHIDEVDVVIHSMAVSDYRPLYMTGMENLPEDLSIQGLLDFRPESQKKVSSKSDYQIMLLEKTPKVINFIKEWKPEVLLFGFKLLSAVSEEELLKVAREKLVDSKADFIIANDFATIKGQQHLAYLINKKDKETLCLQSKEEIAQHILKKVEEYYG